jgi:mRNA interferase MazF
MTTVECRPTPDAVLLTTQDFQQGSLQQSSYIRPTHLITADEGLILYRAGTLTTAKTAEVINTLIRVLTR